MLVLLFEAVIHNFKPEPHVRFFSTQVRVSRMSRILFDVAHYAGYHWFHSKNCDQIDFLMASIQWDGAA